MIGARFNNYRIVSKLGEGGMGAVYRATDSLLERDVALKFLRRDLASNEDLVERFRHEAVTLARLQHPRIGTLFGLERAAGDLFMIMEFVPGQTLEALTRDQGRIPLRRAADLCVGALDALDYAHRAGVIHRDVKPANLMLDAEGAVKVMDFGIARVLGAERRTRDGLTVGTLAYMSPEQIQARDVDSRADLYALGIVLYELLTGRLPFDATSEYALMLAQVNEPPAPLRQFTDAPAEVESVIVKALAKSPADRYQTAAEFKAALLAAVGASTDGAVKPTRFVGMTPTPAPMSSMPTPVPAPVPPPTTAGRALDTRRFAGVAAALLLLGIGPIVWLATRDRDPRPASSPTAPAQAASSEPALLLPSQQPPAFGVGPITPPSLPLGPAPSNPAPGPAPAPRPAPAPVAPPSTPAERPPVGPIVGGAPVPVPVEEGGAPNAVASAAPRPAIRTAVFEKVKILEMQGDKTRERDVVLRLTDDRVLVVEEKGGGTLKSFPYSAIRGAVYSQSKHPRWKSGLAGAAAVGVFAAPIFFMKGTKHWFTLQGAADSAVLRLDKNNYQLILPAFETRSGLKVDREIGDAK